MYCMSCHSPLAGSNDTCCPACGHAFAPTDKTTYLVSVHTMHWLHVPVGLAILAALVIGVVWLAGDARPFVNPTALIWIVGVLVGGLWLAFGPRAILNALVVAVTLPRGLDRDTCAAHLLVFARAY